MGKRSQVSQASRYRPRGRGRQAASYALTHCKAAIDLSTINPASVEWQDAIWRRWPKAADWPDFLTTYESVAYLRISYDSVRRGLTKDLAGRAALKHQKFGRSVRIRKVDLDEWNVVASNRGEPARFRVWPASARL